MKNRVVNMYEAGLSMREKGILVYLPKGGVMDADSEEWKTLKGNGVVQKWLANGVLMVTSVPLGEVALKTKTTGKKMPPEYRPAAEKANSGGEAIPEEIKVDTIMVEPKADSKPRRGSVVKPEKEKA